MNNALTNQNYNKTGNFEQQNSSQWEKKFKQPKQLKRELLKPHTKTNKQSVGGHAMLTDKRDI